MINTTFNIGDIVLFGGKRYTLLERRFETGVPMWLVCATEEAHSKLRLLIEADLLAEVA